MIFLFLLALILFGPKKMPEIGRQVARILNEFRRASYEFRSQIEAEVNSLDLHEQVKDGGKNSQQHVLPPLQAPLGSLASRIFNPPSAELREAADNPLPENSAAVETGVASSPAPSSEPEVGTSITEASKVAPDA